MKRIIISIVLILTVLLLVSSVSAARKHRWYSNQSNTYGWEIMTPEEQNEYHISMQNLSSYDECTAHIAAHSKKMEERAGKKGVVLPVIRDDVCDIMKSRKMYK